MMSVSTAVSKSQTNVPQRTQLTLLAWLGMLLLSRLPQVIAQEFLRIDLSQWLLWLWLAVGLALIAFTYVWPKIAPLRGYFSVLTAVYALTLLLEWLVETAVWQGWFGGPEKAWAIRFFGERLIVVLLALGLAALLRLRGQSRHEFFFRWGNWQAPTRLRLPGQVARLTWAVLGPIVALGLTLLIGWGAVALSAPSFLDWQQLIWLSPAILLFALMNAFGEEVAFRAAPLSQLLSAVGETQAIWLTAVWFGLGHYYGGLPSGPAGAIFLTFIALLFGRAMAATRGISLPIFIHLFGDIVVYSLLAMSS